MCSAEPKKFSRKKAHKVTLYDFLSAKMDSDDAEKVNLNLQESFVNGSASDISCSLNPEPCPQSVDELSDAIKDMDVIVSKDKKFGLAPRFQRKLDERQRKQRNLYFTQQRRDNVSSVPFESYSYAVDPLMFSNDHFSANLVGIPLNSCPSFSGIYPNCLTYVPAQYLRSSVPLQFGGTTYFYSPPAAESFIPVPFSHCIQPNDTQKHNVDGEQSDNSSSIMNATNSSSGETTLHAVQSAKHDELQNESAEATDADSVDFSRKSSGSRRRCWRIGDYCLAKYSEDEYSQMGEASLAELKQLHRDQLAAVRCEYGYRLNRQDIYSEMLPQPPPFPFAPNGAFLIGSQILPCYLTKHPHADHVPSNPIREEKIYSFVDKAIGPNNEGSKGCDDLGTVCSGTENNAASNGHDAPDTVQCKDETIGEEGCSQSFPDLDSRSAEYVDQSSCDEKCLVQGETLSFQNNVVYNDISDECIAHVSGNVSENIDDSKSVLKSSLNKLEQPQVNGKKLSETGAFSNTCHSPEYAGCKACDSSIDNNCSDGKIR